MSYPLCIEAGLMSDGAVILQSNRMFVSAEYCNIVGNIAILIARLL